MASRVKPKATLYVPRSSRQRKIHFTVDIEYNDKGQKALLQIYQGDDLKKSAMDFGKEHEMSASLTKALAVYLRQKSTEVRSKS
eukprot:CFRG3335T1